MRYLSVTEIATSGMFQSAASEIIVHRDVYQVHFFPVRLGIFLKMQKNRSAQTKRKSSQLLCWIFCRSRKQVSILAAFTIKHRLI